MNSSVRLCIVFSILLCIPAQTNAQSSVKDNTQGRTQFETRAKTQGKAQDKNRPSNAFSILSVPVVEAEEIIKTWLTHNGYQPIHDYKKKTQVVLEARRGDQPWRIALSAHTPLATRIRITTSEETPPKQIATFLSYLNEYVNHDTPKTALAQVAVPQEVKDHLAAIVCIYAIEKDNPLQLSGFCIDRKGLILTTAHGLVIGQQVHVLFLDGRGVNGRVVKMDIQRDLCLIRVPEGVPVVIPIRNGRFAPELDEWLFAIGCPNGKSATINLGALDGPPRRVEGFPLWQAKIHIEPGSSGSPVLDDRGRLTAIIKGRYRGTSAIGFLIPFETLLNFLEKY